MERNNPKRLNCDSHRQRLPGPYLNPELCLFLGEIAGTGFLHLFGGDVFPSFSNLLSRYGRVLAPLIHTHRHRALALGKDLSLCIT